MKLTKENVSVQRLGTAEISDQLAVEKIIIKMKPDKNRVMYRRVINRTLNRHTELKKGTSKTAGVPIARRYSVAYE